MMVPGGIKAITFDVFGTLLGFPDDCEWVKRYAAEVHAITKREKPWRLIRDILRDVRADWEDLFVRPGVEKALRALRRRYIVAPLSNAGAAIGGELFSWFALEYTQIIATEIVQAYKPDPAVCRLGLEQLRLHGREVLHVASHKFDLHGAARMGYRTAFIAWPGYVTEKAERGEFDAQVATIDELVAKLCP
jgi:2-haloalkanoic acid dehalogenase type II